MLDKIYLRTVYISFMVLGLLILYTGSGMAAPGRLVSAQSIGFNIHYNPAQGCKTSGMKDFMNVTSTSAWPADAKVAFEHAVSIWTLLLEPAQPLVINACWADLGATGPLATGQPINFVANFSNAPQADTLYAVALANELAGTDVNDEDGPDYDGDTLDADVEIIVVFNSNSAIRWYYGLDAQPPPGRKDLVTVALHEISHGAGFASMLFVDTGDNACGTNTAGVGCWGHGIGLNGLPLNYDRLVENNHVPAQQLIDETIFPNFSVELGNQLKSNNIYFNGPFARAANGGNRPKLSAPTSFSLGSSILHLDQSTYQNTFNRMMTPTYAGPIHHPGPIVMGMFKDMGWNVVDLPPVTFTQTASSEVVTAGQLLTYTLTVTNTGYKPLTNVVLTDTVPAHTALVPGSVDSSEVVTSGLTAGSIITWTTSATLNTSAMLSRTFTVIADMDLTGVTVITNAAFVTSSAGVGSQAELAVPVTNTVVSEPLIGLTQTASPETVSAGQLLTYTLIVTNPGYVPLTDVVLTDTVPAHTTLVPGSVDSSEVVTSGLTAGSIITWTTGIMLNTNAMLSRIFTVVVDPDLTGVTAITNTAFVTSSAGVGSQAKLAVSVANSNTDNSNLTFLPVVIKED